MAKLSIQKTVRKNFTGTLGSVKYVNGIAPLKGMVEQNEGLIRYQKKCFGAEVIDVGKEEHGTSEVHSDAESGKTATVPSGVQPDGTGSKAETPNDGSGASGNPDGTTGIQPGGSGHTDSGLRKKILDAVKQLDPKDDSHWTSGGKPAIAAVEKMIGEGGLTRSVIDEAAPDAKRTK